MNYKNLRSLAKMERRIQAQRELEKWLEASRHGDGRCSGEFPKDLFEAAFSEYKDDPEQLDYFRRKPERLFERFEGPSEY